MTSSVRRRSLLLAVWYFASAVGAGAQEAKAKEPSVELSGVLFGNFQYNTGPGVRNENRFDVERAYITVRAPAGERVSVRVTADVFQQRSSTGGADNFYRGWVVRAKYAYLQYDFLRPSGQAYGAGFLARAGILHTVFIEHVETFWPRWLGSSATERFGFFSSADVGAAALMTLPRKRGEIYATITNGPGYTSREIDRFKDYAARFTLTPLANSQGMAKSLTLSAWGYKGALAYKPDTTLVTPARPIGSSLRRDRWGVFAGLRDPALVLGAEYANRIEEGGGQSPAGLSIIADSTSQLFSAFTIVRPFKLSRQNKGAPLGILLRYDSFRPNSDTEPRVRFLVAGLVWDISARASVALDYQEQLPREGAPVPVTKTYFAHFVANF